MMILYHVSDFQIFNGNKATGVNDLAGFLMMEVTALVSDFLVQVRYNQFGFLPIGAAFLTSGKLLLFTLQFLFRFA